jgi:hypothetical protein
MRGVARLAGIELAVAIVALVICTAREVADEALDVTTHEVVRRGTCIDAGRERSPYHTRWHPEPSGGRAAG